MVKTLEDYIHGHNFDNNVIGWLCIDLSCNTIKFYYTYIYKIFYFTFGILKIKN